MTMWECGIIIPGCSTFFPNPKLSSLPSILAADTGFQSLTTLTAIWSNSGLFVSVYL